MEKGGMLSSAPGRTNRYLILCCIKYIPPSLSFPILLYFFFNLVPLDGAFSFPPSTMPIDIRTSITALIVYITIKSLFILLLLFSCNTLYREKVNRFWLLAHRVCSVGYKANDGQVQSSCVTPSITCDYTMPKRNE